MAATYYELHLKINPEMEDLVSEIFLKILTVKELYLQKKRTKI